MRRTCGCPDIARTTHGPLIFFDPDFASQIGPAGSPGFAFLRYGVLLRNDACTAEKALHSALSLLDDPSETIRLKAPWQRFQLSFLMCGPSWGFLLWAFASIFFQEVFEILLHQTVTRNVFPWNPQHGHHAPCLFPRPCSAWPWHRPGTPRPGRSWARRCRTAPRPCGWRRCSSCGWCRRNVWSSWEGGEGGTFFCTVPASEGRIC